MDGEDRNIQPPAQDQQQGDPAGDYLAELAKLRENSVTKTEYDKMKKERDELIKGLAERNFQPGGDGQQQPPAMTDKERDERIAALRKEIITADSGMNNLKFAEKALELRQLWKEKTGDDLFVSVNPLDPSSEEHKEAAQRSAERVADVLEQSIEYARGDSSVFTTELMRRTNDIVIPKNKK